MTRNRFADHILYIMQLKYSYLLHQQPPTTLILLLKRHPIWSLRKSKQYDNYFCIMLGKIRNYM